MNWCISDKKKLYCAFLDFSKAFDNEIIFGTTFKSWDLRENDNHVTKYLSIC